MRTTVVNKYKSKFDVYIGRPSKWGNPFPVKVHGREKAIELYRQWILSGDGKHLLGDIHEIKGKVLGCFCKPAACHGDVLVDIAEVKHNEQNKNQT